MSEAFRQLERSLMELWSQPENRRLLRITRRFKDKTPEPDTFFFEDTRE